LEENMFFGKELPKNNEKECKFWKRMQKFGKELTKNCRKQFKNQILENN